MLEMWSGIRQKIQRGKGDGDATRAAPFHTIAGPIHAPVATEIPSALESPRIAALLPSPETAVRSKATDTDTPVQVVDDMYRPAVAIEPAPSVVQDITTAPLEPNRPSTRGPPSQESPPKNEGKRQPNTLWERAIADLKATDTKKYIYLIELQAKERSLCGHVFKTGELMYSCTTCGEAAGCVLCRDCFLPSGHGDHVFERLTCQNVDTFCECGVSNTSNQAAACPKHTASADITPPGPKPSRPQTFTLDSCLALGNACESRANALQKSEMARKIDGKGYHVRSISRGISQVVMAIKDIVTPIARLDPHGGAVFACAAVFTVFSVILKENAQHRFLIWCVADILPNPTEMVILRKSKTKNWARGGGITRTREETRSLDRRSIHPHVEVRTRHD